MDELLFYKLLASIFQFSSKKLSNFRSLIIVDTSFVSWYSSYHREKKVEAKSALVTRSRSSKKKYDFE